MTRCLILTRFTVSVGYAPPPTTDVRFAWTVESRQNSKKRRNSLRTKQPRVQYLKRHRHASNLDEGVGEENILSLST
jgi:hypothetical protein